MAGNADGGYGIIGPDCADLNVSAGLAESFRPLDEYAGAKVTVIEP